MKRVGLIILAVFVLFASSYGQSGEGDNKDVVLRSKKGVPITPVKGDWSVGIDAVPFLRYFGNLFADFGNSAPTLGFSANNPGFLSGKYFLADNTAIRGGIIVGISRQEDRRVNFEDSNKTDLFKQSGQDLGLIVGLEKNKSIRGRLRSFYGAEASIRRRPFSGYDHRAMRRVVGNFKYEDGFDKNRDFRLTDGHTMQYGLGGFVGIEYFFAPKVSIAGELKLAAQYEKQWDRKFKPEKGFNQIIEKGGTRFTTENVASTFLTVSVYF